MISRSIAKNTTYMMLASIAQKLISLTYFTIIARTLGAERTGTYTAALAMTTIFVVFVDLGYTNVFIREASKYKEKMQELFSNVLFGKMFFAILSYIALFFTVQALGFNAEFRMLVYLSGITMLFDSLHLTLYGALRAAGNLTYESLGLMGSQLLAMALGLIFLSQGLPILFLILAFTVASIANILYAGYIVYRSCGLRLIPRYNRETFKLLSFVAIPFALAAIFGRAYSYIDVIFLKKMAGDAEVGYYSTPSKISFAFQFIPMALIASLYPKFSEFFVSNKERLVRVFLDSIKFLFIIALPISIGIYILAEDIILLVFTDEYIHSVEPLKILVVSLVFSFLSFPIGAFLNACSKQTAQTIITGIILALNIILNIILIPKMGAVGAAWSALVANIMLGVLGYCVIPRIVKLPHASILKTMLRISVSGLVMGAAVWFASQYFHVLFSIVVGALVYVAMLFISKSISKSEIFELVSLIRK